MFSHERVADRLNKSGGREDHISHFRLCKMIIIACSEKGKKGYSSTAVNVCMQVKESLKCSVNNKVKR